MPLEVPRSMLEPSLARWIAATHIDDERLPPEEVAEIGGQTLRSLRKARRWGLLKKSFPLEVDQETAQDLIIVGACILELMKRKETIPSDLDSAVVISDILCLAKSIYPTFVFSLFNRSKPFARSVFKILLETSAQRGAVKNLPFDEAIYQMMEAANQAAEADAQHRLPQLTVDLPEELSSWTGY